MSTAQCAHGIGQVLARGFTQGILLSGTRRESRSQDLHAPPKGAIYKYKIQQT